MTDRVCHQKHSTDHQQLLNVLVGDPYLSKCWRTSADHFTYGAGDVRGPKRSKRSCLLNSSGHLCVTEYAWCFTPY